MTTAPSSFYGLDPESIFRSMDSLGLQATGELRQLNSYENRVYEIFLENAVKSPGGPGLEGPELRRVVAKYYRPQRWSRETILEEHGFLRELADQEVPVVPPLQFHGESLFQHEGLYFAVFPKIMGRMPDEILPTEAKKVGVLLAQLHSVGARTDFEYRPSLGSNPYSLEENLELLSQWVVPELWARYRAAAEELIQMFDDVIDPSQFQRVHGDFHRGNLLANRDGFLLVDFDDCLQGPVIQDFWMLLQGLEPEDQRTLIEGYESLREFPDEQLEWIPLIRGLRVFQYASWIARRWQDPSFPRLFPQFGSFNYWAEETEALESVLRA